MPDEFNDRTEAPTPRRRLEARRQGRVPRSQELSAALLVLGGCLGLLVFGRGVWQGLLRAMQLGLHWEGVLNVGDVLSIGAVLALDAARTTGPLMAVLVALAALVMLAQVGPLFTWTPIAPSLSKLNPISGFARIFSARTAVHMLINLGKLVLVCGVAYFTFMGWIDKVIHAMTLDFVTLLPMAADLCFRLAVRLAVVMLLIGIIDYAYQRYRHEKDLRMTRAEVREDLRNMEGDPVMKRRRRQVQMQLALQRIRRDVPKADVVVTNPTHVAVALRYTPESMNAPKVVAKGADFMAQRLREVAAAAGVPIVERPLLARMIYAEVGVGREIPGKFFQAVAEVLAYVYELTGRNMRPQPVPVG